jgi:creatinine amidohydrolase/Fe(II)-dependent formamide hydrolase-like protein
MAIAPETVGSERPVVENRRSPFLPGAGTEAEWPESVMGDTRTASADLGRRVQSHVVDRLVETVAALLPA